MSTEARVDDAPTVPQASEPPRPRHRWVKPVVVSLLIAIPAGYGAVAAVQSRDTDGDKQIKAEMAGLVDSWPSHLQRSIYQVPVPYSATHVAYYEWNSWKTSSLYVRFTTTGGGLDTFLAQLGTGRTDLRSGHVTIPADQAKRVGWTFPAGHAWSGVTLSQSGKAPTHEVTVDLDDPDAPVVYVVSTTTFG
ncbi:hypothetical protein [Streptomyces sp. ICBB 8177]|uniref:hypothetical protein n=1 Tax=Streptomyces sp. ICBB 8177 TaxID=563922 RepID=UPI000D67997F|nr:hypothetical protein [Streptomyces sp. ICBB 8177]PWI41460.1 hypothetical protein CK485_21435 [Streptomyces sp. ICBB 8177]